MKYKGHMETTHDLETAGKSIFQVRIASVIVWLFGLGGIPIFIIWIPPIIRGLINKTYPEELCVMVGLVLIVYFLLATTWEKLYFAIAGATILAFARRNQLPPRWALNVIDELDRRYDQHLDNLQSM